VLLFVALAVDTKAVKEKMLADKARIEKCLRCVMSISSGKGIGNVGWLIYLR
jgi:hypothetical protein